MTYIRKKMQTKNGLLTITLFLIVFYSLWGFIFRFTIYGSQSFLYGYLILIFLFSLINAGKAGLAKLTKSGVAWLPYFTYTLAYLTHTLLFQASNFTLFVEWSVCLFLILIAPRAPLLNHFPVKFILWSSFFAMIGIAVQALLPDFYNSRIAGLFVNEETILRWVDREFGFNGFTSQIAITARILLYGEIVLLFLRDTLLPKWLQSNTFFYLLITLFAFCVLLTGKRLHFLVAISLPFIVNILLETGIVKKSFKLMVIVLLIIALSNIFISNIDYFLQSSTLHRFAETYIMAQVGEDFTSGRTELYEAALKAFQDYPIFGIGLENYCSYTGMELYVHNTYLQVLCEQGLVGITLFIYAIFTSLYNTLKIIKREKIINNLRYLKISLGIQIFYIIYCFTGNELYGAGLIMYFLSIAILVRVESLNVRNQYCS